MTVKGKQRGKDRDRKPDVGAKLNALPNTFKFAAEALKTMSERGGSAGSIVVGKYKSYNYKLIFALVMNTIKNIKIIKKIIHEVKLAKKVTTDDPFLLEILVGDLLFGRGLKSVEQNSTANSIINMKDALVKQQNLLKKEYTSDTESMPAKYLRVNHLKSTMEHVLSQLKTVGLEQLEYSKDKIKFKKFINKFKSMQNNEFMLDFHYPNDLIVLKPDAADKLQKTDLLKKGKAMLQDKASFLAVEAMDVKPTNKIVDACCAPGCKTSLVASKMKNKGKILAYDFDKKRLVSAIHILKVQGVTCAKTEVQDFSKLKLARLLKANSIDLFDCILIDPSCSGSGIKNRVDYKASSEEIGRLKKLQAFQVALLKHALKSCTSKSIVYCTCSSSVEENEQVIEMSLNESGVKHLWDVVEILPYWPKRGEANYEFGSKCVRSDADNLTNGFFIAKLQRNQTEYTNQMNEDEDGKELKSAGKKATRLNQGKANKEDEDDNNLDQKSQSDSDLPADESVDSEEEEDADDNDEDDDDEDEDDDNDEEEEEEDDEDEDEDDDMSDD